MSFGRQGREKKPCPYGKTCFVFDSTHHALFHHEPLPGSPEVPEPSPEVPDGAHDSSSLLILSPMPSDQKERVEIDLVTPPSAPAAKERKTKRLKRRTLVIHSSEEQEEVEEEEEEAKGLGQQNYLGAKCENEQLELDSDGDKVLDFSSILGQGTYRPSSSTSIAVTSEWINRTTARANFAARQRAKLEKRKATKKQKRGGVNLDEYEEEEEEEELFDDEEEEEEEEEDDVMLFSDEDEDEDEVVLSCPQCGFSFLDHEELASHMDADHSSSADPKTPPASTLSLPSRRKVGRSARLQRRNQQKVEGVVLTSANVAKGPALPSGPRTMGELLDVCKVFSSEIEAALSRPEEEANLIREQPASFPKGRQLQPHQIAGLNWLYLMHEHNRNGILADEMGLGKTVQAIALLTLLKERGAPCSAVIVVPASVISNWHAELVRWSPILKVVMYYGSREDRQEIRYRVDSGSDIDVFLTTYTTIINSDDRSWLRGRRSAYLIADEAHEVRNSDSQRHKALVKLGGTHRLLLTGTPLHNNLSELLALLYFLNPSIFGNFKSFNSVLEDAAGGVSAKEAQEKAIPAIRTVLNPFLLRRKKEDVLKLPEKRRFLTRCELSEDIQARVYRHVLESKKQEWDSDDGARVSTNILMELRKAASHPLLLQRVVYTDEIVDEIAKLLYRRVPPYYDWSRDKVLDTVRCWSDFQIHQMCCQHVFLKDYELDPALLSATSGKIKALLKLMKQFRKDGKRVLIFSQMTRLLDIVQAVFEHEKISCLRLDGQTPVLDRQDLIDEFDMDASIGAFLLSTKAGGVGITLVGAQRVVFLDLSFNPQWDRQAEDRCHRIGQKEEVHVYRLISVGTIDESIYSVQKEKLALHNGVLLEGGLGDEDKDDTNPADVKSLLSKYFASNEVKAMRQTGKQCSEEEESS